MINWLFYNKWKQVSLLLLPTYMEVQKQKKKLSILKDPVVRILSHSFSDYPKIKHDYKSVFFLNIACQITCTCWEIYKCVVKSSKPDSLLKILHDQISDSFFFFLWRASGISRELFSIYSIFLSVKMSCKISWKMLKARIVKSTFRKVCRAESIYLKMFPKVLFTTYSNIEASINHLLAEALCIRQYPTSQTVILHD